MTSVIILASPSAESALRPGREPAHASAVQDARASAWRKAADDAAPTPPEIEIELPGREDDDNAAGARAMGKRALTLTAERRSETWRWDDDAAGEARYVPVGFSAQRIAQEVLSPGLYHEDFRSALAAYGYAADVGASSVIRTDSVSILV